VRTCGPDTEVFSISEFIAPRELLLNDGSLVDLCEREEWETTEIFGNVAQRFLAYRKTGVLHGERFDTRGMMTIQFVRKDGEWKMSAIAWDDERNGVVIPDNAGFRHRDKKRVRIIPPPLFKLGSFLQRQRQGFFQ
jgi:hypothetical protein